MSIPAPREPGPLVTLVRKRTVAKVDSIVIWSARSSVFDVRHGTLGSVVLPCGRGYLQSSEGRAQGGGVLVARVVSPVSSRESWTVLGDDDRPVEPVERYLAYLTGIERSPNTIKAYAHDLKDWFEFLAGRETDWQAVGLEDVGAFVSWLRSPRHCQLEVVWTFC